MTSSERSSRAHQGDPDTEALQPAVVASVDPEPDALGEALREIARIEERLRALGDVASLSRFGEEDAGMWIAAACGHTLLSTAEARTVDRLARLPDGARLVRAYLADHGIPKLADVERAPEPGQQAPAAATTPDQVPDPCAPNRAPASHRPTTNPRIDRRNHDVPQAEQP